MRAHRNHLLGLSCCFVLGGCVYGKLEVDPSMDDADANLGGGSTMVGSSAGNGSRQPSSSTGSSGGGTTKANSATGNTSGTTGVNSSTGTGAASTGSSNSGGSNSGGGASLPGTGATDSGGAIGTATDAPNSGGSTASTGGTSGGTTNPQVGGGTGGSSGATGGGTGGAATGGGTGGTGGAATGGGTGGTGATGNAGTGSTPKGGSTSGGATTGGSTTGGATTGGVATGGVATGGAATGGAATGGVATGGVATGGVATGGVATGGAGPVCTGTTPTPDCPCSSPNTQGCQGPASKSRLICDVATSKWKSNGYCDSNNNCSQTDGNCHTINPACPAGGSTYCDPSKIDVVLKCDADRVFAEEQKPACSGTCSNGACVAVYCGDGKVEASLSEKCDDHNTDPLDGCEPDCKQTSGVVKVVAGNSGFMCAMLIGGYVRCWGDNTYNQLGQGDTEVRTTLKPSEIPPLKLGGTAADIAAGNQHVCVLLNTGKVKCWGDNISGGQLGQGNTSEYTSYKPDAMADILFNQGGTMTAKAIAAGGMTTCAILQDDSVRCWGANSSGMLGIGVTSPSYALTRKPWEYGSAVIGATAKKISVGSDHVCAILSDGNARCWGLNTNGQLGTATNTSVGANQTPASLGAAGLFLAPAAVTSISSASNFSCATVSNSDEPNLECWGVGSNGQLGLGTNTGNIGDNESPAVYGMPTLASPFTSDALVTQVSSGLFHSCAIFANGQLKCWGKTAHGELGNGSVSPLSDTSPGSIAAINLGAGFSAKQVYAGFEFTCVILNDDSLKCWGKNDTAQLGRGFKSSNPDYLGATAETIPSQLPVSPIFGPWNASWN